MNAWLSVLTQSLILGVMVLGVYISYKLLDFPDLSADGSFSLGGAVIAFSLSHGFNPMLGSLLSLIAGLVAGFMTGILHVKLKISNLLSGILVMGILYSLNLRIMGTANVPLFQYQHLFTTRLSPALLSFIVIITCKTLLDLFLKTGLGYTLKAVGDNAQMVRSLGIHVGNMKILGLMLSNGLIAFSGSLMAQYQGFADINMGIGTLVLGIASIIVGQSILKPFKLLHSTSKILFGTFIYQITIYFAMNLGLSATDLKMITSFVIILFLSTSGFKIHKNILKKGEVSDATN